MQFKRIVDKKETTTDKKEEISKEELEAKRAIVKEEKAILSWESISRPFKKRTKQYFVTVGVTATFFILLATLVKEFVAIAVVTAAVFITYVLALVEPEKIRHKITRSGLVSGNHSYLWDDLKSFWFTKKGNHDVLMIETKLRFPGRLIIVLEEISRGGVKEFLGKYLQFREVPLTTWLDKTAESLVEKLPLEPKG